MKRPVFATLLLSVGLALPGCPIYDDEGCSEDAQCEPGYQCQVSTGSCVSSTPEGTDQECYKPSDCRAGATCDRTGSCRSVDCSWADVGCVDGYYCTQDDGVWRCLPDSSSGGAPGTAGASVGGAAGAEPGAGGESNGGALSGGGAPSNEGGATSGGQSNGGAAGSVAGAGGA